MDDIGIYKLLKSNPNKGMTVLMDKYIGLLSYIVRGRLSGYQYLSSDIEDCVEEAFIKFYTSFENYNPETACIKSYLCVIARNTASNFARTLKISDSIDDENFTGDIPDESAVFDTEDKESLNNLIEAVNSLGHPDSDIILRKYYMGQNSAQIAKDLGKTVSNIDTRAHRALKKLKEKLGGI